MSYILDALRRADSERERGAVPGIHAQPVPASAAHDDDPRSVIKPWMWGVAAAAMVLLGWYEWRDLQHNSAPALPPEAAPTAAMPGPAAPAPVTVPAPVPDPRPPVIAAQPMPLPAAVPTARPPVIQPMPTATARVAPAAPPATTRAMSPPAAQPAASSAGSRVYAVNELPDTIQRELPRLSVGGSIYSDNAASRFLIINGQIFHENDKISSDLVLEQIKLKAAVLRFKGYRYGISY
jgi:general secretion pathway protein B